MIETNELITKFSFKGDTSPLEDYNEELRDVTINYKKTGDDFLALTKKFAIATVAIKAAQKGIGILNDYKELNNKSEYFGVGAPKIQALNVLASEHLPSENFGEKLFTKLNQLQVGQFNTKGSPQLYELMAQTDKTGTLSTPEIYKALIKLIKTIPDGKDAQQMAKTIGLRVLGDAKDGYILYKLVKDGKINSTTKELAENEQKVKQNIEGYAKKNANLNKNIETAKRFTIAKSTILKGDGTAFSMLKNLEKIIGLDKFNHQKRFYEKFIGPTDFPRPQPNNTTNIEQNNTINVDSTKEASQFIKQNADNATGIAKDVSQ